MEDSGRLNFILKISWKCLEVPKTDIYEIVESLSIKFFRRLEVSSKALNFVTFHGRTFHHYGERNVLNCDDLATRDFSITITGTNGITKNNSFDKNNFKNWCQHPKIGSWFSSSDVIRCILIESLLTSLQIKFFIISTAWKVSKHGVFPGPYFPVFGLNTGKHEPEKTSYFDTFHAVWYPLFHLKLNNL